MEWIQQIWLQSVSYFLEITWISCFCNHGMGLVGYSRFYYRLYPGTGTEKTTSNWSKYTQHPMIVPITQAALTKWQNIIRGSLPPSQNFGAKTPKGELIDDHTYLEYEKARFMCTVTKAPVAVLTWLGEYEICRAAFSVVSVSPLIGKNLRNVLQFL